MQRELYKTRNTDKNKYSQNLFKNGLANLKYEMEEMLEIEIENERMRDIVNAVEDILYVNNQIQVVQGLKILTPDEMLRRLPISLAKLKAEYNSEKF